MTDYATLPHMAASELQVINSGPTFLPRTFSGLTTKQNLFISYYLEHRNGVRAAKLAGYQGEYATLNAVAVENLQKPLIREAIEAYFKSRHLSPAGVLAELSDLALIPLADMEREGAVMKPSDKIKALELTGKAQGMFVDRSESVNINIDLNRCDLGSILAQALGDDVIDITPVNATPATTCTDETD